MAIYHSSGIHIRYMRWHLIYTYSYIWFIELSKFWSFDVGFILEQFSLGKPCYICSFWISWNCLNFGMLIYPDQLHNCIFFVMVCIFSWFWRDFDFVKAKIMFATMMVRMIGWNIYNHKGKVSVERNTSITLRRALSNFTMIELCLKIYSSMISKLDVNRYSRMENDYIVVLG